MAAAEAEHIAKSPSDFSCHSYELFVGQEKGNEDNNKEKMSIRSDGMESVSEIRTTAPTGLAAKVRKVSTVSMSECFACCNFFMVFLQCRLFRLLYIILFLNIKSTVLLILTQCMLYYFKVY